MIESVCDRLCDRRDSPAERVSRMQTSREGLSGRPFFLLRQAEEDAAKVMVAEVREKFIESFASQAKMMDFLERRKTQANLNERFARKV